VIGEDKRFERRDSPERADIGARGAVETERAEGELLKAMAPLILLHNSMAKDHWKPTPR